MERVISLINMRQTRGGPDGIRVEKLGDPLPTKAQLPEWKKRILADPLLVGQIVGSDGQHAIITAYAIDMYDGDLLALTNVLNDLIKKHEKLGFKILLTGPPAIAATLNDMVIADMQTLGLWSVVIVILALGFLFRNVQGFGPRARRGCVCGLGSWVHGRSVTR